MLINARWALLKRPENLTDKQGIKLAEFLHYNLKSIRSYLLKEEFQALWQYISPAWAGKFLDRWCTKTMRSKIDPMKKVAKRVRKHRCNYSASSQYVRVTAQITAEIRQIKAKNVSLHV